MSLNTGARIGPYIVESAIGAGGMGEVYRARDMKLNRDVAIKVLPGIFTADPDRLARFTREAQTLAALNHPNIAHVHGLEELPAHGAALVMELVEGEDLSAIIARGPMPLADALPVARQIADALEAAHEQGIVHRDLKPANVKVRADGRMKLLDFGLAKAFAGGTDSALYADPANSPTFASPAGVTQMGVILGTAAYMAPEQARGKAVDKRADIWAFGCVLFEMLAGRPLFGGESVTDTLAAVARADPDWSRLPAATPPPVRRLLQRCLDKEPRQRLRDIGEARIALDGAGADADIAPEPKGPRIATIALLSAVGGAAVTAAILALLASRSSAAVTAPGADRVTRSTIVLPARTLLAPPSATPFNYDRRSFALSADGAVIAFVSATDTGTRIYLRRLADSEPVVVPGTDGGFDPFFSPDGEWLGFFTFDDGGGRSSPTAVKRGLFGALHVSPDGTRVVVEVPGSQNDVYVYDLRDGRGIRLTSDGKGAVRPVWHPDGRSVVLNPAGGSLAVLAPLESQSMPRTLSVAGISSWSPAQVLAGRRDDSIWVGSLDRQSLVTTTGQEWGAVLSPDSRYVAYTSFRTGTFQVFVQPVPATGEEWQISSDFGEEPVWARNGRELYFRRHNQWWSAPVTAGRPGPPRLLFQGPYFNAFGPSYDVAPDGRFLMAVSPDVAPVRELMLVQHWFAELLAKMSS